MNTSVAKPAVSGIEVEIRRARALFRERDYAGCLAVAEALTADFPENRDALFLIAVSQRYLDRIDLAMPTLDRLQLHHPQFSRLYEERGFCYVARKDAANAIEAFLIGVNINPALPSSWTSLEGLYRMTGAVDNARTAAAHVATLKRISPEIISATGLFSDGDWVQAESIVRAYLLKHGNHIEAMRLLARIGLQRDVLDDAELLLEAVLVMDPNYQAARFDYARVLLERHKYPETKAELEKLLKLEPSNRQYQTLYATALIGVGEHEKSVALYRELLRDTPQAADLQLSVAHSLKTLGRQEQAIEAYRAAAAARPNFGDAYWSLANLKTYRFTDAEIAAMRAQEAASTTPTVDRYHLCFALGKALEDESQFAESWAFYQRGNALKREESRYRAELIELNTRLQIQTCTGKFFAQRKGMGAQQPDPIFIIGLPRSGSTLIEQILASHSQVEGTQELADIPRLVIDLQGRAPDIYNPRYPGVLAELDSEELRRLGEKYLTDTRVYRTNRPYFIDKMPNNFRHVGLIHLILPNAKIIDARREPMACCFSNLKQLFANGQEFTYSIDDIARYYDTYLELMAHWNHALPGKVLRVLHETLVDDLEGSVARILQFCGLPFEPACIEFYKTARSVRTASSEQVRQPIFRDGLDQWKNFEPWLGPLQAALGTATARYRD